MPSALENLVKVLNLERDEGCEDTAVIGGLAAFGDNWQERARKEARQPEHYVLIDELVDLMRGYADVENRTERFKLLGYMLDRIMKRVPPAPEYQKQLEEQPDPPSESSPKLQKPRSQPPSPPPDTDKPSEKRSSSKSGKRQSSAPVAEAELPQLPTLARPPRRPRPDISVEEEDARLAALEEPVIELRGVGSKMAGLLNKAGIERIRDMLAYLPRRYDDYTRLTPIHRLQPQQVVTVIGTITHAEVRLGRGGRKDFYTVVDDGTAEMSVVFFGQHFLVRQFRVGRQVVLSGKTSIFGHRLQMTNPEIEPLDSDNLHTIGIVPVYPLTEGLKARGFRRLMKRTIDTWADQVPDYMPEPTLERAELADLGWAIKNVHFPEGWDHLGHASRRLTFDDLIVLQLGILAYRRDWQSVPGQPLTVDDGFLESFIEAVFPFELTRAQRRAIDDIRRDVTRDVPMNRLIQGDVGSGKTAVATVAMGMALTNGKQTALMAPTSILAEQHYRGIGEVLEKMPDNQRPVVALLTSSLTTTERESIYRGLADGSIDVVIGTHALIQEGVEFNDLAVAVIDEQHRFGVQQRGALRGKGTNPHVLVMTATPIPRTLALTMYADLDLTIIDEKPPGRQPVETKVILPVERERTYSYVRTQLDQGRQAFIVHPLVEPSEKIDARSATEAYEHLTDVFHRYRVCLLHGRMRPTEKDEIMAAFANHEYDIMVTTSVAEVGVDVPNASIMMIEGANRFGLAQLHQFRGRVGRGAHKSFCFLIPDKTTSESEQRLKAMERTNDGFRLAEMDWEMRGPGELLGTRQSGQSALRLAEYIMPELVALAQREARTIYEEDPDLSQPQHRLLAARVAQIPDMDSDVS